MKIKIVWMSWNFFFTQMLKVSAFYLEKRKSFIPKTYNLGQESSNRWRFAVPIFREGFGKGHDGQCTNFYFLSGPVRPSVRACVRELHTKPEFEKKTLMKTLATTKKQPSSTVSKRNKCHSCPLNIEKNDVVGQVFDLPANQHTYLCWISCAG